MDSQELDALESKLERLVERRSARRRKASYRKPKRKVDRKFQSSQSLIPTSRLSGWPGSVGPWPMNPYGMSFGGMSMAVLHSQYPSMHDEHGGKHR